MTNRTMESVAQKGKPKRTLYHIGFNNALEGKWTPRPPAGDYDPQGDADLLPEPLDPRISLSPTLEQCFQAVYANVKHLFDEGRTDELTFNVYTPVFSGRERVVYPDDLAGHKLIHDAHITEEHCVLDEVYMKFVGQIAISRPGPSDKLYYYAYGIQTSGDPYGWVPHPVHVSNLTMESWHRW